MDLIDHNTKWEDRAYYYCGQLAPPVVARIWRFRNEDEYDAEEHPEKAAMNLIQCFAKCFEKQAFLLLASDVGPATALRSKKGVLWNHKQLRQLPHIAFEIECSAGHTRVGALVDISRFCFDSASSALLDWLNGMILFSNQPLEAAKSTVERWVSKSVKNVFAYDYDEVSASIRRNEATGILRYLPPNNSRSEVVVVVANEDAVTKGEWKCIDAIT